MNNKNNTNLKETTFNVNNIYTTVAYDKNAYTHFKLNDVVLYNNQLYRVVSLADYNILDNFMLLELLYGQGQSTKSIKINKLIEYDYPCMLNLKFTIVKDCTDKVMLDYIYKHQWRVLFNVLNYNQIYNYYNINKDKVIFYNYESHHDFSIGEQVLFNNELYNIDKIYADNYDYKIFIKNENTKNYHTFTEDGRWNAASKNVDLFKTDYIQIVTLEDIIRFNLGYSSKINNKVNSLNIKYEFSKTLNRYHKLYYNHDSHKDFKVGDKVFNPNRGLGEIIAIKQCGIIIAEFDNNEIEEFTPNGKLFRVVNDNTIMLFKVSKIYIKVLEYTTDPKINYPLLKTLNHNNYSDYVIRNHVKVWYRIDSHNHFCVGDLIYHLYYGLGQVKSVADSTEVSDGIIVKFYNNEKVYKFRYDGFKNCNDKESSIFKLKFIDIEIK